MSWGYIEAVYKLSRASRGAKNLLSYLAHRANDYGECWPSQETIAEETGISQPQIYRFIKELKDINEIETSRKNKGSVTVYKIKLIPIKSKKGIQNENIEGGGGIQNDKKGIQDENLDSQNDNEGIQIDKKGIQNECLIVKNSQLNNHSNEQRKESPAPADPFQSLFTPSETFLSKPEPKKPHHKFSKFDVGQEFTGHPLQEVEAVWVAAKWFMDFCNPNIKWPTFSGDLWDVMEMVKNDIWPKDYAKLESFVRDFEKGKPWPSQVVSEVRSWNQPSLEPSKKQYQYQPDQYGAI